ncbi:class F sortase [Pseudonocardia sp. NPDC049635]|uniref:class F sortase n=1 Tax=Pseudonocardia sp. NPDC049635 TaxID=3155506 RepID=UPI003402FBF6
MTAAPLTTRPVRGPAGRRAAVRPRRRPAVARRALRAAVPALAAAALLALATPAAAPPAVPTSAGSVTAGSVTAGSVTAGSATAARAPAGSTLLPDGPGTLLRAEPVRLQVDRLGLDTEPVPLGLHPDGAMEVPDSAGTVGWFTGAPTPGELGPAVFAAHVDWKGLPGAFADLATLEPGDEIRVDRADGGTVVFAVTRTGQYPKEEFPTAEVYGDLDHAGLRLITCGGVFDRAADSYSDNVVVFAERIA